MTESQNEQFKRTLTGSDTSDGKGTKKPKYAEHGDSEVAISTNTPPKPVPGSPYADTITILVGASPSIFKFHRNVICERSTYFNSRCSGRWGDVSNTPLALEDVDAAAFNRYIHVLYHNEAASTRDTTGTAPTPPSPASNSDFDIEEQPAMDADYIRLDDLVRSYIVADRLGDIVSANIIIDELIDNSWKLHCIPHPETAAYAFHNTVETAPLRKLMVHFYAKELPERDVESMSNGLPKKFEIQVLRETRRLLHKSMVDDAAPYLANCAADIHSCHWHQHDGSVPRCSGYDSEDTGE